MSGKLGREDEDIQAYLEDEDVLDEHARELADLLSNSKHAVFFTGAGISTGCGIPDFRSADGVWTRRDKGLAPPKSISIEQALPGRTHMAMKALEDAGVLRFTISQNVDGLHMRSGLNGLAELHGNCYVEECLDCKARARRDFDVMNHHGPNRVAHYHSTGRDCDKCGGALIDSIIHFGESLPEDHLEAAYQNSRKADVFVVLGSSLTVSPANDMPVQALKNKKGCKLVIVNLQKTHLDDEAHLRVFGKTDEFMERVLGYMEMQIPRFRLLKELHVGNTHSVGQVSKKHHVTLYVGGVPGAPAPSFVRKVEVQLHETFKDPHQVLDKAPFELTMSVWGYFDVPMKIHFWDEQREPLAVVHTISLDKDRSEQVVEVDFGEQPWAHEVGKEWKGEGDVERVGSKVQGSSSSSNNSSSNNNDKANKGAKVTVRMEIVRSSTDEVTGKRKRVDADATFGDLQQMVQEATGLCDFSIEYRDEDGWTALESTDDWELAQDWLARQGGEEIKMRVLEAGVQITG